MKLSFHGAAGEVTGSNYLLEEGEYKVLIDCGLFQGGRFAEEKNFEEFVYDPKTINAVFISHAHLDHIGRLPLLYKRGFRGKIICTPPTRDLIVIGLEDSQSILESEARQEGKEPLYTLEDVEAIQALFETIEYEVSLEAGPFTVEFFNAGHILGSAMIEFKIKKKTILFSGDVGNIASPLFNPPSVFDDATYVVMESVYGDRIHDTKKSRRDSLEDIIEDTGRRGGVVMIPAFALERTQDILYDMDALISQGRIPRMPVFVDSPLAIKATQIYKKYPFYYAFDVQSQIQEGDTIFQFPGLVFAQTVEESKNINEVEGSKVIIAGSGMSQGGRILHHERRYLSDPNSTLLIVGYQTEGSRGRQLLKGAKEVQIMGETIPVRCRIAMIDGYSAHADQQALLEWIRPLKDKVKKVFLVHGEPKASQALSFELADFLGTEVIIPAKGDHIRL